jgi:hypothetical protein
MRVREKNTLSQGLESTYHHRVAFVSMELLQQQIDILEVKAATNNLLL